MAKRGVLPPGFKRAEAPLSDDEVLDRFGGVIDRMIIAIHLDVSHLCEFAYAARALAEGGRRVRPQATIPIS